MTASKEFKLVRKTDNVITDEGSARKIRKLRKADPDKYFIGRSFAKNVGDKWQTDNKSKPERRDDVPVCRYFDGTDETKIGET